MELENISIRGAKEHNLKNINVDIPRNQLVVITGLSGSGKSSLAFDTIYAEGQRRYVESLSAYARQFLELKAKPDVESITGLSPAIAIDQKTTSHNPRSTVSTITEIYDYLRLLYARIGIPYSPATGLPIESQTVSQMVDRILALPEGTKIYLLAPIIRGQKGEHRKELSELKKSGFSRFMLNGKVYNYEDLPVLDKNKKNELSVIVDRLVINKELGNRLPDSIETALKLSDGLLYVEMLDNLGKPLIFSEKFACPVSGFSIAEIEPRIFSFNSPYGACPGCDGLGTKMHFDPDLVVADPNLSLVQGALAPWNVGASHKYFIPVLESLAKHYNFDINTPFKEIPKAVQSAILYGSGDEAIKITHHEGFRKYTTLKPFEGVIPNITRRWHETESAWIREEFLKFQAVSNCESCNGYRLKPEALCIKIADKHIGHVCDMAISDAVKWFSNLDRKLTKKQNQIAERILQEIRQRLSFLNNVGLDYLALSRKSGTLSGGESQRIRLASQIGSGLTGVLYVLDEPSIGLHQCDNARLLETLKNLRNMGNTVIVVEHDEETIRNADYIIDMGIGAGIHGGEVIAFGTPEKIMKSEKSITAEYLSGRKNIEVPSKRRNWEKHRVIKLAGAKANNLQNISVTIPLGTFISVTGVSGGGKSSLVIETLYKAITKHLHGTKVTPGAYDKLEGLEYIDKMIEIDQSPIGRTPRSNPATYTGAFGPIRDWFCQLPEAKARGYKPGRFSFNVKGGRCEACQGDGLVKIEMHFLPDVYVPCEVCNGARYNRETMEVKYKGKSIAEVLDMTVETAEQFFSNIPIIHDKLVALKEVGLGYIKIGQSATTLSGGEAQRIKLAKELSKRATGRTLYILDEPTTGLHTDDVKKLLKVLHKLVNQGNTVLVIEHNLDVIKTSDWVIDIGPGGGDRGGHIIATGTPEDVAQKKESMTGKYLKLILGKKLRHCYHII